MSFSIIDPTSLEYGPGTATIVPMVANTFWKYNGNYYTTGEKDPATDGDDLYHIFRWQTNNNSWSRVKWRNIITYGVAMSNNRGNFLAHTNTLGCICKKCNTLNHYAEPNCNDGTYICFECR